MIPVTRQSDALRDRMGHFVRGTVTALAVNLHGILREVTPVDTGAARDGWRIEPGENGTLRVVNPEEHVRFLNKGSSRQAPAGFVEAAIEQAKENVRAEHGRRSVRAGAVILVAPGIVRGGRR